MYKTLGVQETATQAEITKAYRLLALKHHPDKVPSHQREAATARFAQIQEAYDTLKDPQRRKIYDKTGHTGDGPVEAPIIDPEDIKLFAERYPGSPDEDEDLRDFFNRLRGDVRNIFNFIPFAEPDEAVAKRLLKRLREMLSAEEVEMKFQKRFETTSKQLLESLPKLTKKAGKERAKFSKEYGDASFEELAAKIAENRKRRQGEADRYFLALEEQSNWKAGEKVANKFRKRRN